jgi:hypothetical protein
MSGTIDELKEGAAADGLAVNFKLAALKILRRTEGEKLSPPVANQSDSWSKRETSRGAEQ